ncbi:DUF6292 family protein [Amycolatopsis azurea]|uniref:DUF6292 family protein n=1 Tax=Amycolatopsis azurea TaxID=36819 RepID=UPI0038205BD0
MIALYTGIEHDEDLRRGLTGYLAAVSAAVGVGEESCTMDFDRPASAYIALDVRLLGQPERDMALLWDERYGWAFAMETHSGEDLLVLAYLGADLVPSPSTVAGFVTGLVSTGGPHTAPVPPRSPGDRDDLKVRLRRYWRDGWAAEESLLRRAG